MDALLKVDLETALTYLHQLDLAHCVVEEQTPGRPIERWFAGFKSSNANKVFYLLGHKKPFPHKMTLTQRLCEAK